MPTFTIDGKTIEVASGRTILQALDDAGFLKNGVDVPHFCWHSKLSIDGSCRMCQVEVEGIPKLQIACNTPVQDGMVVHTQNERVRVARERVLELLLLNHPLDCPICDEAGECKLQDYSNEYGSAHSRSREPRRALEKNVDLGPHIVFDQERCILCRRCVRFCREIPKTGELAVFGRGDRSVLETWPGRPLDNDYSMNVVDLCPVGALTTADFRFAIRAWFLQEVEGVCTGCAKGCNIYLDVAKGKVHRYRPRRNDFVNETWLCDTGRLSYREIAAPHRLRTSCVRSPAGALEAANFEAAVGVAATRLRSVIASKGAGVVAGVASAHATNEDLFTFRRFLDALGADNAAVAVAKGDADDLLVEEEKGANAAGARALGFGDASVLAERIRSGGIDAVICLGHDILEEGLLGGTDELAGLDTVIALDTHQTALSRVAHVLFAVRHAAEKDGTLTNAEGRVQRVHRAALPAFEVHSEGFVLAALGAALSVDGFDSPYDVREASKSLANVLPAFEGIDLDSVGDRGRVLRPAGSRAGPAVGE